MPWPVLLNVNQTVVKPFGQLVEIVEINNVGSNCWVTIDGNYVAGPYQQNVISLPAPESVATCELTSTAAPGQANPAVPQGVAILHFHPFAPGPLGVNAPLPNPGVIVGGSGWAAAADPNSLVSVAAGDKFLTSQINQLIDLLTGVMTGQAVSIANVLNLLSGNPIEFQGSSDHYRLFANAAGQLVIQDTSNGASLPLNITAGPVLTVNGSLVVSGQVSAEGSLALLTLDPNSGGALHIINSSTNGNIGKYIRVDVAGNFTIVDSGFTKHLMSITDAGKFTFDGLVVDHFESGAATSSGTGDTTVNFSAAFASAPAVTITTTGDQAANLRNCSVVSIGTSSFTFNVRDTVNGSRTAAGVTWLAYQRTQ